MEYGVKVDYGLVLCYYKLVACGLAYNATKQLYVAISIGIAN